MSTSTTVTVWPELTIYNTTIGLVIKSNRNIWVKLQSFIPNDASLKQAIDITDASVEKLVKTFPNLTSITLHSTRNLSQKALPPVLKT